jgi:N-acylglucosamine 2-epimerase
MNKKKLSSYRVQFEKELFESVIPFWEKYSPDYENGGFFNCLDEFGNVYDKRKHIWLQGRETWLFSKLYNTVEQKEEWLKLAENGATFLLEKAKRSDDRVFFSVTEKGEGLWMQRKIFSECFYVMALAEYSRASGDDSFMKEAKNMFKKVWEWSEDLTKVGQPVFEGQKPSQGLAIPMILLNLIVEVASDNWKEFEAEIRECIRRMLMHVHEDKKLVFETVAIDGSYINDIDGRLLNPGHAIEAGWFLQHWAKTLGDQDLSTKATNMIRWSYDKGWDSEYGGIFYFLDSEGYSPTQLEWDMKLWWPHTEAMYAHLLNYSITKSDNDFKLFEEVTSYSFDHFSDPEHGEWFGYLNRKGDLTHRFKGGPYKGCFHVPRALLLCWNLLRKLEIEG